MAVPSSMRSGRVCLVRSLTSPSTVSSSPPVIRSRWWCPGPPKLRTCISRCPPLPGPQGPSGPWQLYDDTQTRDTGDVPVWSDRPQYEPRSLLELGRCGAARYTQPEGAFTAYHGDGERVARCASRVCRRWRTPITSILHGHVRVSRAGDATTRVAIVVRLGDASSGQIVGKGHDGRVRGCVIVPHYSSQESGKTNLTATPDGADRPHPAGSLGVAVHATAVVVDRAGSWSVARGCAAVGVVDPGERLRPAR